MAKTKEKNEDLFWKIASDNYNQVQGWPKWKQSIVISSSTASTGRFLESESSGKKAK